MSIALPQARAAALVLAVLIAGACGTIRDPSAPPAVPLLTATAAGGCGMQALAEGVLVRNAVSGLSVGDRPTRWPFGWSAVLVDGRVRLYDATDRRVAIEGDTVSVGGGLDGDVWDMCGDLKILQLAPAST